MMRVPRNLSFLLTVYFIAGGVILVTSALIYNNSLIRKMSAQAENTTRIFSRLLAIELDNPRGSGAKEFIPRMRDALGTPYIITDLQGRPMIWNQIGIPMDGVDWARAQEYNPALPKDSLFTLVYAKVREFDRLNDPIPVKTETFELFIHYGHTPLSRELAVAPYVQVGVFVLFMLFGLLGFRTMKIGEQRSIWVGMAKETAHQLGTPLSSLMGWIAIIREETAASACTERLAKAIEEIDTDVDRLAKISERFSKIGSAPKLEYQELTPIVEETVAYFERRRPTLRLNSTITVEIGELPVVRCSRELIGWVIENLIKNALDAIASEEGKIHIEGRMNERERRVELLVSDTGKGMSPGVRKRIFTPGYTTKSRGWGLGLALVKRIVEDIHGGTIRVLHTQPGKGTTFIVTFPVD